MMVGNGRTAKFWEDRWIHGCSIIEIAPLLYDCIPKRRCKQRTVANILLAHNWTRDIHTWDSWHPRDWAISLSLAAHRAHNVHGGAWSADLEVEREWRLHIRVSLPHVIPWLDKLPGLEAHLEELGAPSCQILSLVGLPRPLTWSRAEGFNIIPGAHSAIKEPETMSHLILEYSFSRQIWHEVLSWLRMTCRPPSNKA